MVAQLQVGQIEVLPGQQLVLRGVNWAQFEAVLSDLGEDRGSRIASEVLRLDIKLYISSDRTPLLPSSYLKTIPSNQCT